MIFRSRYPQPSIPDQGLSEFALRRAGACPDRTAIVDAVSGRRLTYRELRAGVEAFAGGLAGLGVRQGDVVGILLPNLPEFPVAFLGTVMAGGVVTTLNPAYTAHEVAAQLADSGARLVITTADCVDKVRAPEVRVIAIGDASGDAIAFDELLRASAPPPRVVVEPALDLAVLPYSSGTTGLPKGVMLTHRNMVANAVQCEPFYDEGEDHDVMLAVAPFFHIMGMTVVVLGGLCRGATLVSMPRFDLPRCLAAIEEHRVTVAIVAPPVIVALAKHPLVDAHDLSSLRVLGSGGAPLGAPAQEACGTRLGCRTMQGWGMTEVAGAGTGSPPPALAPHAPGTVGWCVAGAELRVVDPVSGADLGASERGELWFRGPNVMRGYLNNPGATADTLTPDGWCRTGDIGIIDADGFVRIVDRLKELIKYKGYQVAPAELEATLVAHPLVVDAAVVASPDEEAGEVPKAFLVLREDADPDRALEEITAYMTERLAHYKRPRRYELIEAIPRTPSGKIVRRGLIERERQAAHAAAS